MSGPLKPPRHSGCDATASLPTEASWPKWHQVFHKRVLREWFGRCFLCPPCGASKHLLNLCHHPVREAEPMRRLLHVACWWRCYWYGLCTYLQVGTVTEKKKIVTIITKLGTPLRSDHSTKTHHLITFVPKVVKMSKVEVDWIKTQGQICSTMCVILQKKSCQGGCTEAYCLLLAPISQNHVE